MSTNPKDPLLKADDAQRELFTRLTAAANGFQHDHVIGAAANLLLNAIRQQHATQRVALDSFDQLMARFREVLAEHFDGFGRRRNVFPFHQRIEVPLFDARPKH